MSEFGLRIVALLPRLRGLARTLARSRDAADDLVQATCEKALRNSDGWTPGTRLDAWLFRIMRNHWIDTVRRGRPEVQVDDEAVAHELPVEDGVRRIEARLTLAAVRTLVDALPDDQRTVLMLVCVEDLSYRDAAEMLELPIGTVMSRLSRARAALVAAMDSDDRATRLGGEE
ncbi:RNA polymerase sigma factor [Mesorhizobium sp. CAU 1741]|uniref:RNA polymerase sigma factor n=1 Tax=Mesorhizobium sp. CAU 1741 TaxID=3140366 RepID=UPI00325A5C56